MNEWISVNDKKPPKDRPFLALTLKNLELMEWKERIVGGKNQGWYGFYCPCSCCSGFCTSDFELWMPLPKPPEY